MIRAAIPLAVVCLDMTAYILNFEEIGRQDLQRAGGKAANLGELAGNAFPIPPGFVISSDACRLFFKGISLTDMLEAFSHARKDGIEAQCRLIQEKIQRAEMPERLSSEILAAYDVLANQCSREFACVVRSSATAEDLGDASFAGQHATYYYVSRERLLAMVKHCWASLWNPEAAVYRSTHGMDPAAVWMAVIVQEMIPADVSGVTFTADPVSGSREEVVTEASWGMGAAIVDGRVTPDHYRVEKESGRLREKRIADKRFMVPPHIDDGTRHRLQEIPHDIRRRETLSPESMARVTRWALKAEQHFGAPQDVEWAIADGRYFMLQSRPITTMGRAASPQHVPGQHVLFKPLLENFTDPITPLTGDCYQFVFTPPLMHFIHRRLYVNVGLLRRLLPLKISEQQLADFLYEFDPEVPEMKLSWIKLPFFVCFLFLCYLLFGVGFARTRCLPADFMKIFESLAGQVDRDESFDIRKSMKRLFWWSRFLDPVGNLVFMVNLSSVRYFLYLQLLKRGLARWAPESGAEAASLLSSGTESVLSAEMGREIWDLSKTAQKNAVVREHLKKQKPEQVLSLLRNEPQAVDFLKRLDAFLSKFGHRGLKELELRSPRWQEEPSPVLGMIRNYMLVESDPGGHDKDVQQARVDLEWTLQQKLRSLPLEKILRLRWRVLRYLANRVKYFARIRENSRFYHIMGFYIVRRKIRRMEESLLRQGKLKCRDDIFFLHLPEIERMMQGDLEWQDVELRIRQRRMEHIRLSKSPPPKTVGLEMREVLENDSGRTDSGALLQGHPASPGRYEGIARVILDPALDVELRPGEILIAPYTDPAWTPLFLTAGAAVVEVGSYLSHAGTVAREFGMPCVVDLSGCTTLIQTGERIAVDGDTGSVTRLRECGKAVS